ncbi:MAG TPA: glycosyltransferase family 2 protein [Candidatus Babeliales bacterium]|nr:glycosyltransferase family 2 protein [Candidatus Babeliales bacterium]
MNYTIILVALSLCYGNAIYSIERPIVVVVCSYNNEKWSENTLNSIMMQKYNNFRVIIVDDCSTDNNANVIQKYIIDNNFQDRIIFIQNEKRYRKLFNLYRMLYECDDDEIVVMVDGDDSLAHLYVLSYINSVYDDENIWFTYGQYRNVPASQALAWGHKEMGYCRPIPKHIQRKQAYRYYSFIYMHPRSFRGWLFKLVKLEDLIADNVEGFEGDLYPASNDVAMYFPMVEMSHNHIKFISDILYIRNLYSEIVGFKVDRSIQTASAREIRQKACYAALYQPRKDRLAKYKNASTDLFLLCRYNFIDIKSVLENIQEHTSGIETIYVFFTNTVENKKLCRSIKKQFPHIIFIPYDVDGNKNLKNRLLDYLSTGKSNHVCIMTDASSIIQSLDFSHYIFWLEKTYSYRFYLNRHSLDKGAPRFIPLDDNICAWKFSQGSDKWRKTVVGEDTFLCRKSILYQEIKNLHFNNIYSLLKEMHFVSSASARVGLFLKNESVRSIF